MMEVMPTPRSCPTCGKTLAVHERRWMNCGQCGGFPQQAESPTDFFIGGMRFEAGRYVVRRLDFVRPADAISDEDYERMEIGVLAFGEKE